MCEARLNNGSSNHNVYTNDTRQTRSEHSNQQNIADECIPVHSGETQERAQRRHTNVRILIIFTVYLFIVNRINNVRIFDGIQKKTLFMVYIIYVIVGLCLCKNMASLSSRITRIALCQINQ